MSACAACGKPAQGNSSIHRDGFGEGPEVGLCDDCGMHPLPTCEELWRMIAERRPAVSSLADARKKRDEGGNK